MKLSSMPAWLALGLTVAVPGAPAWAQESLGTSSQPLEIARPKPAPGTCRSGYVWREARPSDKVCVPPATRDAVARQNRAAPGRWVQGAYGKHTCVAGYVWREAFKGDDVCVRPAEREQARRDNAAAAQRRAA